VTTDKQRLKEAYDLIGQDEKEQAREILVSYIDERDNDPNAWWLMAHAVDDPQLQRESLERVLELDPEYAPAQKKLQQMNAGDKPKRDPSTEVEYPGRKQKPKRGGAVYNYPLNMRFKIIALAPQIYITDASDAPLLYVRQKILNLREDVRIFRDDSKDEEIFRINTDQIIDIGALYRFTDSRIEQPIGAIKQRGLKTIWRAHYDIMSPNSDTPTHELSEDNPWVKVADAIVGDIPILGMFAGYILHPSYTVHDTNGTPVMQLRKEPSFFERKYTIHLLEPGISAEEEKRLLLGVMMMIQLNRARG